MNTTPESSPANNVEPLTPALLSRNPLAWLTVFGPGAIIASLTIGTGELIFSTRGGAIFGYRILFLFLVISILKWGLVFASARHIVISGVHPYQRMMSLPGPRGWFPLMLFLMAAFCMPVWVSFHSTVLGNMTAWITGTRSLFNGGIDYLWGAGILTGIIVLTATGGYTALERVQMVIVMALVVCAGITIVLYNLDEPEPHWLEMLEGAFIPPTLEYPQWLLDLNDPDKHQQYLEITKNTEWVEMTRYVGVIGGAGYDYMAYTSFLRDKRWGRAGHQPATAEELDEIAADKKHPVRLWLRAPLVDCTISFIIVVAFSAVFIASGAMVLGPKGKIPTEDSLLDLQAELVTGIHPWLLPIYVVGALLTMLGTLYGTFEIAHAIHAEIARCFNPQYVEKHARKLKFLTVAWCALGAFGVLGWMFVYQNEAVPGTKKTVARAQSPDPKTETETIPSTEDSPGDKPIQRQKPRALLALLTPVNLFTGVLGCGLFCFAMVWMDHRFLPAALRMPYWLAGLNILSGGIFLGLGLKGYWDDDSRWFAIGGILFICAVSLPIARFVEMRRNAGNWELD